MNSIILFPDDFTNDTQVRLAERRHEHIREILKSAPGSTVRAGLLNGLTGTATIVETAASYTILDVNLTDSPPAPLPLCLVMAMPRPKVFRRVLQGVSSMGVKKVHVVRTWRVDKSYFDSPVLEKDTVTHELVLGLEQGRDTILPEVFMHPLFRPFAEDILPRLCDGTMPLLAHPGACCECPRAVDGPVTLFTGPEGGLIQFEIELLIQKGFLPVSMGARILRVETAIPALIGRLF